MGIYERFVLPRAIDFACGMKAVAAQRAKIVPEAGGRVLEVGVGSGLNLPYYAPSRVSELIALDPSPELLRMARAAADAASLPVRFVEAGAERIPLEAASVDTVVMTYTLCSIPDPDAALSEIRRVLRPGGRLLFSEHGRSPDERVRRWQDRLNPLWKRAAGGCHLNRDVPAMLSQGGFEMDRLETGYLKGPKPMTFNYLGAAMPA
ncbi:MAG TPA: class I SAM-dependent methyltransferase [Allosphingosinicella sp.]|jgi:ubiquinone/menaquinone biosynthesis C-methylase UbiE|nr:class I SAM-dependent methyltransferase [Allosphingosinicella sp.]